MPLQVNGKSVAAFRFPVATGFISQPKGEFLLKINDREAIRFDVSLTDGEWESADQQLRMHYTVMEANSEDSNGILQVEVPASMIPAGRPIKFEVTASPAQSQRWFGIYLIDNQAETK